MRRHHQAKERGKTVNRSGMAAYCRIAVWWSSAVHASWHGKRPFASAKRVLISFFFMVFADTVLLESIRASLRAAISLNLGAGI